jgi:hypothetical protein
MAEYRFKRSYDLTSRHARLLKVAFFTALISFCIEIDVFFLPDMAYSFDANWLWLTLFAFLFAGGAMILLADIFLWIGMLRFIVKYDDRAGKSFWFVIVLFGLNFGAALYYFFVYRKYLQHNAALIEVGRQTA